MALELYCLRIIRREGHQKDNEGAWPIGSFIYWRPEIVEDNHGPGGWASYESTRYFTNALFKISQREAERMLKDFTKKWPGIVCEIVKLAEV